MHECNALIALVHTKNSQKQKLLYVPYLHAM